MTNRSGVSIEPLVREGRRRTEVCGGRSSIQLALNPRLFVLSSPTALLDSGIFVVALVQWADDNVW